MKNKINAYQKVLNQVKSEDNLSYRTFDSIKKYIEDGTNKNYTKSTRLRMLGNGNLLCFITLEHMSASIPNEIEKSIVKIMHAIAKKIRNEIKTEFSQNFSDAYEALEELKKITIVNQ
jgi:hypothetical protein